MEKTLLIALGLFVSIAYGQTTPSNENIRFGLPSDGTPSDEVFLANPYFAASYSFKNHQSNWVAWQLSDEDYNQDVKRQSKFKIDPFLKSWTGAASFCETILEPATRRNCHIQPWKTRSVNELWPTLNDDDYTGSGFDRGHMLRSEDRTATEEANIASFYMTNVFPQKASLNQGPWVASEMYIQWLAQKAVPLKKMAIVVGGIFNEACSKQNIKPEAERWSDKVIFQKSFVSRRDPHPVIAVPRCTFKLAILWDASEDVEVSTITGFTKLPKSAEFFSVIMPNVEDNAGETTFRTTDWTTFVPNLTKSTQVLAWVKKITGYRFFPSISRQVKLHDAKAFVASQPRARGLFEPDLFHAPTVLAEEQKVEQGLK